MVDTIVRRLEFCGLTSVKITHDVALKPVSMSTWASPKYTSAAITIQAFRLQYGDTFVSIQRCFR